jgi:uncharacterized Zn finger protein
MTVERLQREHALHWIQVARRELEGPTGAEPFTPERLRPRRRRESRTEKAERYLAEGRVIVLELVGERMRAQVKGGRAVYIAGHDEQRGWWCSCPAASFRRRCSHVDALQLITGRTAAA